MKSTHSLDKFGFALIALLACLLPFFFVPLKSFTVETSKVMLLVTGVALSFFVFLFGVIKRGEISFPSNKVLLSVLIVPGVFLASALLAPLPSMSLFGYGLEVGTWAFVMLGFVLLFLTSVFLSTRERVFFTYISLGAGFLVVLAITLGKLFFGPDALVLGALPGVSGNPVGVWTDLAVLVALGAALIIMALEMLEMSRLKKVGLSVLFVLSLLVLSALNFSTTWLLLLVFSLVFFIYLASAGGEGRKVSYPALALLFVSLVFLFNPAVSGRPLGDVIAGKFGMSNIEVRPSLSATSDIVGSSLQSKPLLGTGPRTFETEWLKHKPQAVNQSNFWNVSFPYGFGLLPTFIVTTGILGLLAWIFFLVFFVRLGVRSLWSEHTNGFSRFLIASSFLASLFLWVLTILYVPRVTIFALAFLWTGIFIAVATAEGVVKRTTISFAHNAKMSFLVVLLSISFLIGDAAFAYTSFSRATSNIFLQKAFLAAQEEGNFEKAALNLDKALSLGNYDTYHRAASELYVSRFNMIIGDESIEESEKGLQLRDLLARSIGSARKATETNPENYRNWMTLGSMYESLMGEPFSVEGAYESAASAYTEALSRNPRGPDVLLSLARLEVTKGDNEKAREYLTKAIEAKNNYADAYFLLAQLEIKENRVKEAIEATEVTALLAPDNAGIFFQLGLLKYNNSDWNGAVGAFNQALIIAPDYANAKYFLGLSYDKLGDRELAVKEFQDLKVTNPDNEEVNLILSNLESNKDPFAGAPSSVTSRPERRDGVPIETETNQ